jgi:hypothetical protein
VSNSAQSFLFFSFVLAILLAGAYVACAAPCESLGWMPLKDLPARCLEGRR